MKTNKQSHILTESMVTYSVTERSDSIGVLPTGTRLYYRRSFPEGFDQFYLYVNIEGAHLPIDKVTPSDLIDPLTSFVDQSEEKEHITTSELDMLLRSLGVKKSDILALLETYE